MSTENALERKKSLLKRRDVLLDHLHNKVLYWQNNKIKSYINNISPGCKYCFEGYSTDINLNQLCTRSCFFCPQARTSNWKITLGAERVKIESLNNLLDFLHKFKLKVISFSGGEPLLSFDTLCEYLKSIKTNLPSIYLMMYTNGDLLTEERAKILSKLGLDEIRFNLSARKYNLKPVKIAKKYIPKVSISIPAIPEEINNVKNALKSLVKLKIDYFSFIELIATPHIVKEIIDRKYLIKSSLGILDSEISALEILKYITDNKIPIAINYCTAEYKQKNGTRGVNMRYSKLLKKPHETITKDGKIKEIYISLDTNEIKNFTERYSSLSHNWFINKNKDKIYLNQLILNKIDKNMLNNKRIIFKYYDTLLRNSGDQYKEEGESIKINNNFSIKAVRQLSKKIILKENLDIYLHLQFFINNKSVKEVFKDIIRMEKSDPVLFKSFSSLHKNPHYIFKKLYSFYERFSDQEYFGEKND